MLQRQSANVRSFGRCVRYGTTPTTLEQSNATKSRQSRALRYGMQALGQCNIPSLCVCADRPVKMTPFVQNSRLSSGSISVVAHSALSEKGGRRTDTMAPKPLAARRETQEEIKCFVHHSSASQSTLLVPVRNQHFCLVCALLTPQNQGEFQ